MKVRWLLAPVLSLVFASSAAAQMTPSQAVSFVKEQHSTSQMVAALGLLSPSDRQYVISYALTPRTLVVTESPTTSVTVPVDGQGVIEQAASGQAVPTVQAAANVQAARRRKVRLRATAASCGNWSHDFTAKSYSWAGLWQFTFHSQWQWSGCNGNVTAAHHQERGDTAIGWGFDNSQYGAGYGCMGCSMIGRETFGHFSFIKYAIHDTADLQVQVHGNGGWWAWANITGP